MTKFQDQIIARYKFDDAENVGKDSSGQGNDGIASGTAVPTISHATGRAALALEGGPNGTSYIQLPFDLFKDVSDNTGVTVTAWVNFGRFTDMWERVFDFGKSHTGPYMFMTRNLRGTLFTEVDLSVDPGRGFVRDEWMHIALSVIGTKGGTLSSAGPVVYVNGEVAADGSISQTSSGKYAKLRKWFETFADSTNYSNNFIGRSQHAADVDFAGLVSDFRIYKAGLTADEVIEVMCDSLTDAETATLARR